MLISFVVSRAEDNLYVSGLPGEAKDLLVTTATLAAGIYLNRERTLRVVPWLQDKATLVVDVVDRVGKVLTRVETRGRSAAISCEVPENDARGDDERRLLREHGRVFREGGTTIVEIMGKSHLLREPGVTCANPDATEEERIYQKVFSKKRIYLPDEYDRAIAEHLAGRDAFVIGMNGYSSISEMKCREYGIDPGAYEIACEQLLAFAIKSLRATFPDIDVRVVHGASAMGVDLAIQRCARGQLRNKELGFSCPQYLFYVEDDEYPVYVASNVHEYSQAFVKSCNVLIAANGRLQAFRMDIMAVFEHDKYLIPVNVIKLISCTGSPAAKNAMGQIEDAVAHYEQRVFLVGRDIAESTATDRWRAMGTEVCGVLVSVARHVLPKDISWKLS